MLRTPSPIEISCAAEISPNLPKPCAHIKEVASKVGRLRRAPSREVSKKNSMTSTIEMLSAMEKLQVQ